MICLQQCCPFPSPNQDNDLGTKNKWSDGNPQLVSISFGISVGCFLTRCVPLVCPRMIISRIRCGGVVPRPTSRFLLRWVPPHTEAGGRIPELPASTSTTALQFWPRWHCRRSRKRFVVNFNNRCQPGWPDSESEEWSICSLAEGGISKAFARSPGLFAFVA